MATFPITLKEAARMLHLRPNKIHAALRARHILDRNNMPYRQYVQRGLLEPHIKQHQKSPVGPRLYAVTKVTEKGLEWLANEFEEEIARELAS